jgi:hypothetical protein
MWQLKYSKTISNLSQMVIRGEAYWYLVFEGIWGDDIHQEELMDAVTRWTEEDGRRARN